MAICNAENIEKIKLIINKMKIFKNWYFPDTEEHFINYLKDNNTDKYQYEQRNTSFSFLDKKRVAIDIGANVGLWAKDICKIFKEVKLFEPFKLNAECLNKNLENYSNFQIFDCALSNKNSLGELYIHEKGLGANSLVPSDGITKTENIQLKKLDDFEFQNVDYIKIDVQFHELEVIEGSINTLKKNNPVLCVEAARRNEEELAYVKKFIKILNTLNYKIIGGKGKELFFKK